MNFPCRNLPVTLAFLTLALAGSPILAKSKATSKGSPAKGASASPGPIPEHYSKITYPEFAYVPPHPKDFRVVLDRGVVAYLVPDTNLALIQMSIFFGHPNIT